MRRIFAGGLGAAMTIVLALMISACAATPNDSGSRQARAECQEVPNQTGSRLPRRSCRDTDSAASSD
jgi:hypothetical protein